MSTNEAFIPNDYEQPKSGGGYTKLETGENRFRLLSSPLFLWSEWRDGKPIRHAYDRNKKPAKGGGQKDSVKHAWGLVVWNYKTEQIEIFELDKQDVIASLTKHAQDADWGHPKHYDVIVTKTGSGMETEYSFLAKPKKKASQQIIDAFIENPVDLSKLLVEGGNCFINGGGSEASTTPAQQAKVVTPENWAPGDDAPDGYTIQDGKIIEDEMPF